MPVVTERARRTRRPRRAAWLVLAGPPVLGVAGLMVLPFWVTVDLRPARDVYIEAFAYPEDYRLQYERRLIYGSRKGAPVTLLRLQIGPAGYEAQW